MIKLGEKIAKLIEDGEELRVSLPNRVFRQIVLGEQAIE